MKQYFLVFVCVWLCLSGCGEEGIDITLRDIGALSLAEVEITQPPPEVIEAIWSHLDPEELLVYTEYYQKYIHADGIPIIGSELVPDDILYLAREVALRITSKRPKLREKLSPPSKQYHVLTNYSIEKVVDIPEIRSDPIYRSTSNPRCSLSFCVSIVPEQHTKYSPFAKRNPAQFGFFVHEFAHAIHHVMLLGHEQSAVDLFGWDPFLVTLDPNFDYRLWKAYETAVENGTWEGTYAATNYQEYWAEGVYMWYYNIAPGSDHRALKGYPAFESYEAFAEHDSLLVELLREWFHEESFRDRF